MKVSEPSYSKSEQTHPRVGPITALALVLVLGTPGRFGFGKQVASYLGLIPCEDSSADSWRLGRISKQGNALRFLLGQAAQSVARSEEQWRHQYAHLALRRNHAIAKVAMAQAGGAAVLDVVPGMGLPAAEKVRFARGRSSCRSMVRSRSPIL